MDGSEASLSSCSFGFSSDSSASPPSWSFDLSGSLIVSSSVGAISSFSLAGSVGCAMLISTSFFFLVSLLFSSSPFSIFVFGS